jgi:alpha-tubulin suppressor-like RCC1 family protein
VACWGYNVDGELGNGTFTDSAVPVSVKTISNAIGLSGGIFSQCATRSTGKIACWGNNVEGELGNGTLTNAKVPVAVKNIANASSVEGNAEYDNCALLTTSGVDCWGNGQYGQLGNGIFYNTTIYVSEVPVAVLAAA